MKVDRWEEYQTFFQLIILKYLVVWFSLVPVVAGLISQLPDPLPITISGVKYNINLSLPFHWQMLWLSSFFFVLALILYKVFCPKFIIKYNNFSEYTAYKHHPRWLAWETHALLKVADIKQKAKLTKRFLEKKYIIKIDGPCEGELCLEPNVGVEQTSIIFKYDNENYQFSMPILPIKDGSEKDVFYEVFGRYSESRTLARVLIKILLIISFLLFSIVLIQHIYNGGLFVLDWVINVL